MINTKARLTDEVTDVEMAASRIALQASKEGIVLLKNDGMLPLTEKKLALYGEGAVYTFKGGTGSGEVNPRHVTGIWEGLENAGYQITTEKWLTDYRKCLTEGKEQYKQQMRKKSGVMNVKATAYILAHPFNNPHGRKIVQEDLSDAEIPCFYVISRQTGENADRRLEPGELYLTEEEIYNITICCKHYKQVALIINSGGYVELEPVMGLGLKSIVFFCQQGQEGGNALASILCGETTPSAHLTFTWPKRYTDIPYAMEYGTLDGKELEDDYKEGIYVGYRYFDTFRKEVEFPFGYGLSYTRFSYELADVAVQDGKITVRVKVGNSGKYKGKSVLQLYVSCPAGKLEKEQKRLVSFVKTEELLPGDSMCVQMSFQAGDMASYDESTGEYVLEQGNYMLLLGEDAIHCCLFAELQLEKKIVLSRHEHICKPEKEIPELSNTFKESKNCPVENNLYIAIPKGILKYPLQLSMTDIKQHTYKEDKIVPTKEEQQLLNKLSDKEKTTLVIGAGNDIALPKKHAFMVPGAGGYTTSKFEKRGIPAVPMADGPTGLRLFDISVVRGKKLRMVHPVMAFMEYLPLVVRKTLLGNPKKGKLLYQYATAYPVGMAMASSWNVELMEQIGKSVQTEMEAFGVNVWLAPGINLYRNPLCGRTYEYYSEDPVLAGKLAAALIRGVQHKPHYTATVKHFCCNNREVLRRYASSNIRERPLRELYLRVFEIAVKEGKPGALMTSYNKVNDCYTAESYDLLTKVVRNEWGFEGLILTDWTLEEDTIQAAKCIHAGVDLFMQGAKYQHKQLQRDLKNPVYMTGEELNRSAAYVMRFICGSSIYDELYIKEQNINGR